jgi:hypothetical protein
MAPLLLSVTLLFLSAIPTSGQTHKYTVVNKCPTSIKLYIAGSLDSTLATGASITKSLGIDAGFFYTDANGGNANGAATRAGFYDDNNSYIYYLVRDSSHFNTGMSITPNHSPTNGFCPVAICEDASCTTAFSQPPTRFPPPVCGTPPTPPVYSCPYANLSYTIMFCPSGSFPSPGQAIHPNFDTNKCMDVRGANYANGTPVQIYDCNGTGAQRWVINEGSTKVKLAGTNFCLDAGSSEFNDRLWEHG